MLSWCNSQSSNIQSILEIISIFFLFYFGCFTNNRDKADLYVCIYFWSGVEPSEITGYSLLNLLLMLLS